MADRNLDVRMRVRGARAFHSETKKAEKGIRGLGSSTGRAALRARAGAKAMSGLGSALRGVGRAGLYAGGALAAGGAILGKRSIEEWREAERVMRSTEQRIKTTGGVANVTARQIGGLAQGISFQTGIDDEEIQKAGNLMLTFRGVRNEAGKGNKIFSDAMRTAIDMSSAYDQSVKASSISLGKALQEPAKMATALKRTGAVSDADVERLKSMDAAGASLVEQQKELLRLVNRGGVRGAAAAEADQLKRLQVAWSNTEEAIGRVIGPPAMRMAGQFATKLEEAVIPEIENLAAGMNEIWDPSENRSMATNLRLSRKFVRRELGPVWGDVKKDIDRANLDDKLAHAFSAAVPKIMEAAGEGGGRAMVAFGRGWLRAPFWSQLLTVGLFAGKLGAFKTVGEMAAGKFKDRFAKKAATGVLAETATTGVIGQGVAAGPRAGRKWGRLGKVAGKAFGAGLAVMAGMALRDFFKSIPALDQYSGKEGWGELARDIGDWAPGADSESLHHEANRPGSGTRIGPRRGHPNDRPVPPGRTRPKRAKRAAAPGSWTSPELNVTVQSILDGKVVAESTGRHVADRKARR